MNAPAGGLSRSWVAALLIAAALAETLMLLALHRHAIHMGAYWRYTEPDEALPWITETAPLVGLGGLIVPACLLMLAGLQFSRRGWFPRLSVHAMGWSIVVICLLCVWMLLAGYVPAAGGLITGME